MASILNFPHSFFAESPKTPRRTSPSAEEAALNRPRLGPRLVVPTARPVLLPGFGNEESQAISSIDLEIARRSNRTRLRSLFSPSDYSSTWPLGAA